MSASRSGVFSAVFVSLFFSFFLAMPASALDSMPPTLSAGGQQLVLNGMGARTKFILTVYHAGLYLPKKSKDADNIINANQPMAVRLKIISGFANSKKVSHAITTGFNKSTGGKTAPIRAQIQQFMAVFKAPIKKGDVFEFVYTPAGGTKVTKNGKGVAVVKGLPFKKALFGIWLSKNPAQNSLKRQMLGMGG